MGWLIPVWVACAPSSIDREMPSPANVNIHRLGEEGALLGADVAVRTNVLGCKDAVGVLKNLGVGSSDGAGVGLVEKDGVLGNKEGATLGSTVGLFDGLRVEIGVGRRE